MTSAEQDDPEPAEGMLRQLSADWSPLREVDPSFANVFISQVGASAASGRPDGIYLAAGHVSPPVVLGTPEEMRRHLDEIGDELPVKVLSHVFITRDRAEELIALLIESVAKYDAASGGH